MQTAIIGAGPAGLLFALISRIRMTESSRWRISLFDKRTTYSRTHRLRIDPAVFRSIQRELSHSLFDELCAFLDADSYTPVVNELETFLSELCARIGVFREPLALGNGAGETDLHALQRHLGIDKEPWTIVGADSVRSTVRQLVGPDLVPRHATHEQLVRLILRGPGLPDRLNRVHQYRLSKVLGSVLSYRLNKNGYGEVDLFLSPQEHGVVAKLGANPREPVGLRPERLSGLQAPLFGRIVALFCRGFGEGECTVDLQSSFRLEHSVSPRRVFRMDDRNALVFLVGDAAVALPFQRGISCMGKCANELARIHVELLTAEDRFAVAARYDECVDEIVDKELRIVRARARLVRGLREFVRMSSLLPFPIQSWFLSVRHRDVGRFTFTPGFVLNFGAAALASAAAYGRYWTAAWILQTLGGVAYRAALSFESPPHRSVKAVWQMQIVGWLVVGLATTLRDTWAAGAPASLFSSVAWWVGGLPFALGIYLFEFLGNRWFKAGELE